MAKEVDVNNWRENLVQAIKDSGMDLVERAEDLVGSGELLSDLEITISFDLECKMKMPTIDVQRTYFCKNAYDRLIYNPDPKREDPTL